MAKLVDWVTIKELFVTGDIDENGQYKMLTVPEIVARCDVSETTLYAKAKAENWELDKNLFLETLNRRKRESKIEALAGEAANLDMRILGLVKDGLTHLEQYLSQQVGKNTKEFKSDNAGGIPLTSLVKWSQVLERLQRVGKVALGDNPDNANPTTWVDILKKAQTTEESK